MSHSVTTTATYMLLKYSRSYPQTSHDSNSEWQHFTKPVIKIILDVKKSSTNGELESVLLRIIWSIEGQNAKDRNEIIFENFDLLSFSSFPSRQADKQQGGLPLKAVYRDSVVGIRYLDPSSGTFRRFQITFQSASDASQFIDSISSVCPSKPNTTTGVRVYNPEIVAPPSILHHPVSAPHPPNFPQGGFPAQTDMFSAMGSSHRLSSYPTMHFNHPGAPYTSVSGIPMPMSSPPMPIDHHATSSSPPLPVSSEKQFHASRMHSHSQLSSSYTPTPSYSQPQPSVDSMTRTLPSSLAGANPRVETSEKEVQTLEVQTSEQFISALREATSLYHLPHSTLEKLVGEIVREDGFAMLMENLSTMWKVKGYIG